MPCRSLTTKASFTLKLFEDESTKFKLGVMNNMECLFDDERNVVPDLYYEIVEGLQLGESLKITIEKV